jgi:hypothetical protein
MDLAGSTHSSDIVWWHQRRPCKDLSTKSPFERVLAVTSATVDVMAKSFQRPRKVHFFKEKNGHFCFPSGCAHCCSYENSDAHLHSTSVFINIKNGAANSYKKWKDLEYPAQVWWFGSCSSFLLMAKSFQVFSRVDEFAMSYCIWTRLQVISFGKSRPSLVISFVVWVWGTSLKFCKAFHL